MTIIDQLIGNGPHLNSLQMCIRAVIIFLFTLGMIRFSGMRVFGIKSAFDTCIIIMLGSILAKAVVGSSPFIPTIVAGLTIVLVHKLLAKWSMDNHMVGKIIKGSHRVLYKNNEFIKNNMQASSLSEHDILEEARLNLKQNSLENVQEVFIERSGKISFIKNENLKNSK